MNVRPMMILGLMAACLMAEGPAAIAQSPTVDAPTPAPSMPSESVEYAEVAAEPGCEPARAPRLNEAFAPIEHHRTVPIPWPIRADAPATSAEAREAGLTALEPTSTFGRNLRYRALIGTDLVSYYGRAPVSESDTVVDFLEAGGIMVVEGPPTGQDLADRAAAALGDQGTVVAVGAAKAVMNHGTEIAKGVRPYYLFWTDRGSDWTVVAGMADPSNALDVARSLACR